MRIVLASWAPFHAGAEVAAERLAAGLREAGNHVTVILGTEGETLVRMRKAGLDARYIPLALTDKFRWWRYQLAQREIRRLLREVRPDIVHANDLPTSQMVGQAAGRFGVPRVCHHRWFFNGPAVRWLNKFGAEVHIFVSRAFMSAMLADSPELRDNNCCAINDAIQAPRLPSASDRLAARAELGISTSRQIVLFAGQMIERKGVDDLLHAWKLLPADCAQAAELILVGEDLENAGSYRTHLQSLAAKLEISARFVGFQQDVGKWITAADVCVVPSHNEPFGLAVLEAMAHARPVIGANIGGIPEMIVDGHTGLLVPSQNPRQLAAALAKLLADAQLRDRFGAAARTRCEQTFSLENHVAAVVGKYQEAMSTTAVLSR